MNAPAKKLAPSVQDALDGLDADRARNIAQRISAVMAEVDYIQKEQPKENGLSYSVVTHDAVTAKVRPLLHRHGIIYYPCHLQVQQDGNRTEAIFVVRFENIDNRLDYIDVGTFGYGVDKQDKGPGKAMSYGVKYALLKVLGLETGDDPDNTQDDRADHRRDIGTGEPKPKGKGSLDGPYTCPTQLKTAGREFVRTLESMGDLGEFVAWEATIDFKEFCTQLERDLPSWWAAGDGLPGEFVPLQIRIADKRRELTELDEIKTRETA